MKDKSKRTADGQPVHSFRTLLDDLATLTKNRVRLEDAESAEFYVMAEATPVQQRAFELLGLPLPS